MSGEKIGKIEYVLFPTARFKNQDGIPICAINPECMCAFLTHGTRIREESFCTGFGDPSIKRLKFDEEIGSFPVLENCPIWSGKVKEIPFEEAKKIAAVAL
jgi:hypothetical protein